MQNFKGPGDEKLVILVMKLQARSSGYWMSLHKIATTPVMEACFESAIV